MGDQAEKLVTLSDKVSKSAGDKGEQGAKDNPAATMELQGAQQILA